MSTQEQQKVLLVEYRVPVSAVNTMSEQELKDAIRNNAPSTFKIENIELRDA